MCVLSAVYILVNIEQTPEKQKVSLASVGSVETAESANVKSFGKYRRRAGRCVGHFAAVSLRISHFLKAPLKKKRKKQSSMPFAFISLNKPELLWSLSNNIKKAFCNQA